jgi:hypothetical protein
LAPDREHRELAEPIHIDCVQIRARDGDFKLPAEIPAKANGEKTQLRFISGGTGDALRAEGVTSVHVVKQAENSDI